MLEGDATGRCVASGVRANIWARARRRAEITHRLRGGGKDAIGWGALRWQETINTDEVCFGRHVQLRWLARRWQKSRVIVHALLEPLHIARLLRRLKVSNM